jgi:hypothetical protein
MSESEQLYGREATEAAQGWTPMPLADAPAEASERQELDAALTRLEESRPDEQPIVERRYLDADTQEPRPENETVRAEDAARQLSHARKFEAELEEGNRLAEMAVAADELRGELQRVEEQPGSADPAITAQPRLYEQPQQPEQESQPGSRLEQVLRNDPHLLGEVTQYAEAVRQNGEQAVGAAAAAMTWNAQLAASAILGDVPELQGLNNAQISVALQMLAQKNPQRAAEIQGKLATLNTLAAQARQAQTAQAEAARQRFGEWSQEQDAAFEIAVHTLAPGVSPAKIRGQAMATLRNAGISDQEMRFHYNNSPLFRSAAAQTLMAKAAAFDLLMQERVAQKTEIAHKRTAVVPTVQRPGVSLPERPMEAGQRLPQKFANAKDAANWLSARRAAR